VDVTGRDADAATAVGILALTGRDDAGAVRADEPRFLAIHGAFHLDHVIDRNAFGNGNGEFNPSIHSFKNCVSGERRRDEDRAGGRAGLFHGVGDGVKDRDFLGRRVRRTGPLCRA
jgi:hypothetical protein